MTKAQQGINLVEIWQIGLSSLSRVSEKFSTQHGTIFEDSYTLPKKWVFEIYLIATNLEGISSMKPHRELSITQKSAWFISWNTWNTKNWYQA